MRSVARAGLVRGVVVVVAVTAGILVAPRRAVALDDFYCGYLISSSQPPNWGCYGNYESITYNRAEYDGGGTIDALDVALLDFGNNPRGGHISYSANANFNSLCFTTRATTRGVLSQYEASGAHHTISGRVDDSLNHTGCF